MSYLFYICGLIVVMALAAWALQLILGETGMLSIAHAVPMALGAYSVAVFGHSEFIPIHLAIGTGLIAGSLGGLLTVIPTMLGLTDDDYAMSTLIIQALFIELVWNLEFTGGPIGLGGVPSLGFGFGIGQAQFTALVLMSISAGGLMLLGTWAIRMPIREVLNGIRTNELFLIASGYNTKALKVGVGVVGGAFAGVAGALFASHVNFISPREYGLDQSLFFLTIVIFGGLGSFAGAIVGAIILVALAEAFRFVPFGGFDAASLRQAFMGLVLLVTIMYKPTGLLGRFRLTKDIF